MRSTINLEEHIRTSSVHQLPLFHRLHLFELCSGIDLEPLLVFDGKCELITSHVPTRMPNTEEQKSDKIPNGMYCEYEPEKLRDDSPSSSAYYCRDSNDYWMYLTLVYMSSLKKRYLMHTYVFRYNVTIHAQ